MMREARELSAKPTGGGLIREAEVEFRVLAIADDLRRVASDIENGAWHLSNALDAFERLLREGDKLPTLEPRIRLHLTSAILAAQAETSHSELETTKAFLQKAFDAAIFLAIYLTSSSEERSEHHPDFLRGARDRVIMLKNLAHNRSLEQGIQQREDVRLGVAVRMLIDDAKGAAA